MAMPKVSVIIPTYDLSHILVSTIQSVLNQTMGDLQVIVVDDGSSDDTQRAVNAIDDPRLSYYYKENGGVASARNYGLARAEGEYIAFLDHDDLWPIEFLEVMIQKLEKNPTFGLTYTFLTIRYPDGKEKKSYKAPRGKSGDLTVDLFKRGFIWTSATVIRKSVLNGFTYDESLRQSYEDGDFFLRLSTRTQFLFVKEAQAIRRDHSQNLSAKTGKQPTRILVLERFYYKLGGRELVPFITARKKISHACRKVAKANLKELNRGKALVLFKKAIRYWPLDIRLYAGLVRAFMLDKSNDQEPEWQMPKIRHI